MSAGEANPYAAPSGPAPADTPASAAPPGDGVRFILSERDFLGAMWLNGRGGYRFVIAIMTIMAALGVVSALMGHLRPPSLVVPAVAFAMAFWVRHACQRRYRETRELQGEVRLRVAADGLELATSLSSARIPWDHVLKLKISPRFMLVYRNRAMFHVVPRHAFKDDVEWNAFLDQVRGYVDR